MTQIVGLSATIGRPVAVRRRGVAVVHAAAAAGDQPPAGLPPTTTTTRRSALLAGAATAAAALLPAPLPASAGDVQMVSEYLPAYAGEGGQQYNLRTFVPGPTKTPALRAGTVTKPYSFAVPPSWREARVANIQSGNYCQPKCEEPWTEVVFESPDEGSARVIVSPLRKLTPRAGPGIELPIDAVGSLTSVIAALGSFVTGTYLEPDDVLDAKAVRTEGGDPQYQYEVNAAGYSAKGMGPHAAVAVAAKGDLAFLFVVSANDKQWAKCAPMLRAVSHSFRA